MVEKKTYRTVTFTAGETFKEKDQNVLQNAELKAQQLPKTCQKEETNNQPVNNHFKLLQKHLKYRKCSQEKTATSHNVRDPKQTNEDQKKTSQLSDIR